MNFMKFKHRLLVVCMMNISSAIAYANVAQADVLETIEVTAVEEKKKVAQVVKTAEELKKEMVSDSRDLVRYETGVTVVEAGRFGSSGYAIRGVDENRVGISIDGLRQAETLSSPAFKELFEGYGNFNNTRNSVEMENVQRAIISKGADSISSGSGALGGSVMFNTKEANDFLTEKDYYASYKRGYQSMNNQNLNSFTLASRFKWLDFLAIYTKRDQHEIENYHYDSLYKTELENLDAVGPTREKTDPYHIKTESSLFKLGIQPNDQHRLSFTFDDSKLESNGQDLSYLLTEGSFFPIEKRGERFTHDTSNRRNLQLSYKHSHSTPLWDNLNLSVSHQKINNKAHTDEYCARPDCNNVENKYGLELVERDGVYRVVDKDGGDVSYDTSQYSFLDSQGNKISGLDIDARRIYNGHFLLDCSKIDCSKKIRTFVNSSTGLQDKQIQVQTGSDGKQYGTVEGSAYYVKPFSYGYQNNQFKDRDLNTNTKQLRLDLDKAFDIINTQHKLKYGALFEKSDKSMVNQDGYSVANVKWWSDIFVCNPSGNLKLDALPPSCYTSKYTVAPKDSYLIPVQTQTKAFHFGNDIQVNDWLGLHAHYRYDQITLKPKYDADVPVPKGLIAGVFVPLPDVWFGDNATCGYNTDCMNQNLEQNLAILLQNRKYSHHSYNLGFTFDPTDWLRIQAKYSNGFRAPTSDEVYMTFKHPSFSIRPNVNLRPEIAKTKEVALTLHRDNSFLTTNVFKTDYKDFIDLAYAGQFPIDVGSALNYPFYQSTNRNQAEVKGVEVASRLDLETLTPSLQGFHFGYKMTYQRGRMDKTIPMNAIQPMTMVYNLGYLSPDEKYGLNLYATQVSAKKAKDTYNSEWEGMRDSGKIVNGQPVSDSTLAWRNNAYTVFDAIAHVSPWKNMTLSAGIYNLTNKKYMTWDSARSIRNVGTINLIEQETGTGINRFYAPERNYRFALEFKF